MMADALQEWDEPLLPQTGATPAPAGLLAERNLLADRYGGYELVLRVVCRDLPRPADAPGAKTKWSLPAFREEWNLNYAGLTEEEARQLLPKRLEPGARHEVSATLGRRLVREYLIDNAHGTAPRFADQHVERAGLTAEVVGVQDDQVSLRFVGTLRTDNGKQGYEADLLGQGLYDHTHSRWAALELVSVGTRWGYMHHSGRGPWWDTPVDPGPAPMGIVCALIEGASEQESTTSAQPDFSKSSLSRNGSARGSRRPK
jgi:hypothetical protein